MLIGSKRCLVAVAAATVVLTACSSALAQQYGGYGAGAAGLRPGMTGARGVQTSGFGATGGGYGGGYGGGGFGGGFGNGAGGFGGGGFGGGGVGRGAGGLGAGGTIGGMNQSSLGGGQLNPATRQMMNQRFQRGNFVGRDAADVETLFQSQNGNPVQAMMGAVIENLNQLRESRRRWRERQNAPPPIHVQLKPSSELMTAQATPATREVQTRINGMMRQGGLATADVVITGRVAVLRGTVATDHDRALAERLASLEPGVSRVQNLLTIEPDQQAAP